MICFVIAMEKEAAPLFEHMNVERESVYCGKRVFEGFLFGKRTAAIICGVGKVNAALGAQIMIDRFGADKILNIGVAGGLNNNLKIGEIYGIEAAVQYDFDLTVPNGTKIGTLDEFEENYLPTATASPFPLKKLATGDRFNDSERDYLLLRDTLNADIRDMEGGAIAQACTHANVKFYCFKSISDIYGSGSTFEQYKRNLAVCFENISKNLKIIWKAVNE